MSETVQVVAAGHVCLDIIPSLAGVTGGLEGLLVPGKLTEIGAPLLATGGPVSNTGLAMHKIGVPVSLMGKVGDDPLGQIVVGIFRGYGEALAAGMIVASGEQTSYTVVINPPGVDRIFLHCHGANDTFIADDVDYDKLDGAKLFHFGYPPLMKRMYNDGGEQLESLLRRVKAKGLTTSLDMAFVDPGSEAGRVDWPALLARVLPYVDVFEPSIDEILFMLDRDRFDRMQQAARDGDVTHLVDGALISDIGGQLLEMGPAVLALKLGSLGLYLRTTGSQQRLASAGATLAPLADAWAGRELLTPCFEVEVVGTTGSGDATIAGLLTALTKGLAPADALTAAVAIGACNVEAADSLGGIRPWDDVQARLAAGWKRRPMQIALDGWRAVGDSGIMAGPNHTNG